MYKSMSQRRKFHELWAEGKIKGDTVREFDKASKGLMLPDRVDQKPPKKKKPPLQVKGLF
jgi:hypothetical protein